MNSLILVIVFTFIQGYTLFIYISLQCALLYTTIDGQRRIRVTTLSVPCTTVLSSVFIVSSNHDAVR